MKIVQVTQNNFIFCIVDFFSFETIQSHCFKATVSLASSSWHREWHASFSFSFFMVTFLTPPSSMIPREETNHSDIDSRKISEYICGYVQYLEGWLGAFYDA